MVSHRLSSNTVARGQPVDIYLGVSRPARKRLFYILSIGLGVAGFCAIPFIVGMPDDPQTINTWAGFGIVLFVANASCTLIIPAIGWWLLMRAEGIPEALNTFMLATSWVSRSILWCPPPTRRGTLEDDLHSARMSRAPTARASRHYCGEISGVWGLISAFDCDHCLFYLAHRCFRNPV